MRWISPLALLAIGAMVLGQPTPAQDAGENVWPEWGTPTPGLEQIQDLPPMPQSAGWGLYLGNEGSSYRVIALSDHDMVLMTPDGFQLRRLADGAVVWDNVLPRAEELDFWTSAQIWRDLVLIQSDNYDRFKPDYSIMLSNLRAYSLQDGRLLWWRDGYEFVKADNTGIWARQTVSQYNYTELGLWDETDWPDQPLYLMNPADGTETLHAELTVPGGPRERGYEDEVSNGAYSCRQIYSDPENKGTQLANDDLLVCIPLIEGKPRPGAFHVLNPTSSYDELVQEFLAHPDPASDNALMRRVVESNQQGLHRLLDSAGKMNADQLDAAVLALGYVGLQVDSDDYETVRKLLKFHLLPLGQSIEPQLVTWIEDERLAGLGPMLKRLLIESGGPLAARWLRDNDTLLREGPPLQRKPWQVCRPSPEVRNIGYEYEVHTPYDLNAWAEQVGPDGARYAVFVHDGLISNRDLWLGIDIDGDGSFDELLPTGLYENAVLRDWKGRMHRTAPGGELSLELKLPQLVVRHNVDTYRIDELYGQQVFDKFVLQTDTLSLPALSIDTDGDGLTDVAEGMLQLDPRSTDTDTDGWPDNADPAPNVNPAAMGPVERGVSRALEYYYSEYRSWARHDWLEDASEPTAFYLYLDPPYDDSDPARDITCGPVAFHGAGRPSICLWTEEQRAAYQKGLPGTWGSAMRLHLIRYAGSPVLEDEFGVYIGQTEFLLRRVNGEYYPYTPGASYY